MAAAIPYGIMAGQAIYGYIKNRQAAKAEKDARAQEQSVFGQASGVSNQLTQTGTQLTDIGVPAAQRSLSYYDTLLRGSRSAMANATAGPRGAITDTYRGAERSLEHSGVQGAQRDLARSEFARDRAGKIADLTSGVQPAAAASIADIGTNLISQGGNRLGNAGTLWGGLLGNRSANTLEAAGTHQATSAQLGKTIFDILSYAGSQYHAKPKTTGGVAGMPGGAPGSF